MMLSDVCLPVCRVHRENWHRCSPRHTWLGHHFQGLKVKGHQAALLTAVLTRQAQAAAVVGVGTCWPWAEVAATLPSARPRAARRFGANGEERGAGYIMAAARLQPVWPSLGVGRGPKNIVNAGASPPSGWGVADPLETRSSPTPYQISSLWVKPFGRR